MLGRTCLGVRPKGSPTDKCEHCSRGKSHRQVSRRKPDTKQDKPGYELWTDLPPSYQNFARVMFITDAYSGMVFPYFMRTQGKADETKLALRDFVYWVRSRYDYETKIIRSDGELFKSKKITKTLRIEGISSIKSRICFCFIVFIEIKRVNLTCSLAILYIYYYFYAILRP